MSPRSAPPLRITLYLLSAMSSALPLDVHAQDETITPPRLITPAEATYPADARALGLTATVPLRLSIDAEGKVTAAEVIEPQGHGFDEAATEAGSRFVFEPARKDGIAMPARIVYRYVFAIEAPIEVPVEAPIEPVAAPAPQTPVATPPTAPPPTGDSPIEVTLQGRVDHVAEAERSAEAVDVVDVTQHRARSMDTGDVLARTEGVVVRRGGGLGSQATLMLDGLDDDRLRFFIDSVPIEQMGFALAHGLLDWSNLQVDLINRIEIYRGVVPVRFGVDTLGGVIHFVTDELLESTARASYDISSFNTHRASLNGRYYMPDQHLMVRAYAGLDYSDNSYPIGVEIADERGRLSPATVDRFHDAYLAAIGWVEAGYYDASWIKRLALRVHGTLADKELQNNIVMTVPYGDARYGGHSYGATLRLAHDDLIADNTEITGVFGLSRITVDFVDVGEWVYNWRGDRVRQRQRAGEITGTPIDVIQWQTAWYDRVGFKWNVTPEHSLQLTTAQEYITRNGDDRLQTVGRDPEQADRDYFTMVSGIEWDSKLWDKRIENQAFAKHYALLTNTEEVIPGGIFRRRDRNYQRLGAGDGLRFNLARWLWLKASYELATELPKAYQYYGDGALVQPNLDLTPETSHNLNLSLHVDYKRRRFGHLTGSVRGFVRRQRDMILLLGNDRNFMYQNVYEVFSRGVVADAQWDAPAEAATLYANLTLQDLVNDSTKGTFSGFNGDMLPNRPWFFANLGASGRLRDLVTNDSSLLFGWDLHYTPWFYRGWESQGDPVFKQKLPTQLVNDVYVTYELESTPRWSITFSIDNVFDAKVFEQFGAQRPGRSFALKLAAEI